ncbi:MAG: outer membrane protein assembly factor BamB [Gammaproteobacteria bacterium]|nr:MAG: outer membrane protein assembly factor BamB [Gammaproteobacteria bacterium]
MNRLVLLLTAFLLAGCSLIPGMGDDDDNAEPPAELEDISSEVVLKKLWSTRAGVGYDEQFVKLVPAVEGPYVLLADRKGRVTALSAESGKQLWQTKTDKLLSAGPGAGEELVLVGTSDAEVLALSLLDGSVIWEAKVTSEVLSVPQIDRGVVVVQTADGNVAGLSAVDGSQLWIYDRSVPALTLRGTSTPAVEHGIVLAGFASGKLAAISTEKGFVAWETSVAIPKGRSELDRMVDVDADPVIVGTAVYVVSYQGRVVVIDIQNGNLGWTRDMSSFAGLGVDFAQVYVTDQESNVWALTRDSGDSVWKQDKLFNRALTAPEPYSNYVAVGDFEGYLHLLSRYDGHIVARTRVDSDGISARPVYANNVLYVYGNGGTIAAYALEK